MHIIDRWSSSKWQFCSMFDKLIFVLKVFVNEPLSDLFYCFVKPSCGNIWLMVLCPFHFSQYLCSAIPLFEFWVLTTLDSTSFVGYLFDSLNTWKINPLVFRSFYAPLHNLLHSLYTCKCKSLDTHFFLLLFFWGGGGIV